MSRDFNKLWKSIVMVLKPEDLSDMLFIYSCKEITDKLGYNKNEVSYVYSGLSFLEKEDKVKSFDINGTKYFCLNFDYKKPVNNKPLVDNNLSIEVFVSKEKLMEEINLLKVKVKNLSSYQKIIFNKLNKINFEDKKLHYFFYCEEHGGCIKSDKNNSKCPICGKEMEFIRTYVEIPEEKESELNENI